MKLRKWKNHRLLKVGEIIRPGDQFMQDSDIHGVPHPWSTIKAGDWEVGSKINRDDHPGRRPIKKEKAS